jgi:hypothetical protein
MSHTVEYKIYLDAILNVPEKYRTCNSNCLLPFSGMPKNMSVTLPINLFDKLLTNVLSSNYGRLTKCLQLYKTNNMNAAICYEIAGYLFKGVGYGYDMSDQCNHISNVFLCQAIELNYAPAMYQIVYNNNELYSGERGKIEECQLIEKSAQLGYLPAKIRLVSFRVPNPNHPPVYKQYGNHLLLDEIIDVLMSPDQTWDALHESQITLFKLAHTFEHVQEQIMIRSQKMQLKINELETAAYYAPGGPGFLEAQQDWNSHVVNMS